MVAGGEVGAGAAAGAATGDTDGGAELTSDVAGPDVAGPDVAGPDVAGPDVAGPDAAGPDVVERRAVPTLGGPPAVGGAAAGGAGTWITSTQMTFWGSATAVWIGVGVAGAATTAAGALVAMNAMAPLKIPTAIPAARILLPSAGRRRD